jgi:hypothetical protein
LKLLDLSKGLSDRSYRYIVTIVELTKVSLMRMGAGSFTFTKMVAQRLLKKKILRHHIVIEMVHDPD